MGKLIIQGNSVYEIDEECYKSTILPKECEVCLEEEVPLSAKKEDSINLKQKKYKTKSKYNM